MTSANAVIWHDIECGSYRADLSLWRSLADERGGPVLEIGAGTGRVALDLARHGFQVSALDNDPVLVAELTRRADDLPVTAVLADARDFELAQRFPLIIVPMQAIQLLGGADGRIGFLRCACRHLEDRGVLAATITRALELYEAGDPGPAPLPDIRELDGVVYSSQPTAVRDDRDGFVLERRRETVSAEGRRAVEQDLIRLDRLSPAQLEGEARAAGLRPAGRSTIPATQDHSGSVVVMLSA